MNDYHVNTADDVTDEVLQIAFDIVDGWYPEGRIDWENVWDRMDKSQLADGRELDMGSDLASPAQNKIKREVRKYLKT